jgi:hypothetical protein
MSRAGHPKIGGDHTPVTGVQKPPKRVLRRVSGLNPHRPRDPLTKHMVRLLGLHPDALRKFADVDLESMNTVAKTSLLTKISSVLGEGLK